MLRNRLLLLFISAVLVPDIEPASATVLSDAAASLQAGQYVQITSQMSGVNAAFQNDSTGGGTGVVMNYSDSLVWDPIGKQIKWCGGDHNVGGVDYTTMWRCISYNDATNTWGRDPYPSWGPGSGTTAYHAYEGNMIDYTNRKHYFRGTGDTTRPIRVRNLTTGTWTTLATFSGAGDNDCCPGGAYFPERGTLVFIGEGSFQQVAIFEYNITTNTYTQVPGYGLGSGKPAGAYHHFAEYNPVHKLVWGGGGSGICQPSYLLNAAGTVTQVPNPPSPLCFEVRGESSISVDTVSGDFLISHESGNLWKFNPITLTFSIAVSNAPWIVNNNWSSVGVPNTHSLGNVSISTYGVVLWINCPYSGGAKPNCQMWLYKHTASVPAGSCSLESGLKGRGDLVFCEPWESSTWWQQAGYDKAGMKNSLFPLTAGDVSNTSITTAGCLSGNCLNIHWPSGSFTGLSVHWRLASQNQQPNQLYLRYYLKIGTGWPIGGSGASAGKFLGLADLRGSTDPGGQCGNGSEFGDGINCWSGRENWRSGSTSELNAINPGAVTRIGWYLYYPGQGTWVSSGGVPGHFDTNSNNQFGTQGLCDVGEAYNNFYCGKGGYSGLLANQWYRVELYVKMNAVGQDDGILRAWVDGNLAYEKTNMRFRIAGHDKLHVRTVWLDFFAGGPVGASAAMDAWIDQLVVATSSPVEAFAAGSGGDTTPPAAPSNLSVQ